MTEMTTLKRSLVAGAAVVLTTALGACSGGSDSETPSPSPAPQNQSEPAISDPRDASAVELCQLLPAEAATSLGLQPTGEADEGANLNPDAPPACTWKTTDEHGSVALGSDSQISIQDYYDNKAIFVDYRELTIAGHPAVQGNRSKPEETGNCWVYVGTKENQVLSAFAFGVPDPCSLAQNALEASVPTLPAAK